MIFSWRCFPGCLLCGVAARQADWRVKVNMGRAPDAAQRSCGALLIGAHGCTKQVWVPDLRSSVKNAAPRRGHETALHRCRGYPAVDDDGLAGHEARGIRAEIGHRA